MWDHLIDGLRYDPMRGEKWSDVEMIYAVERVMSYMYGEPMLQEMTFVLRDVDTRKSYDFRTWNSVGPIYIYAHDELNDHTEWLKADVDFCFYWHEVYRKMLPVPDHPEPFARTIWGHRVVDGSEMDEEEEEPEEDPEEKPMEEQEEEPEEEEPMEEEEPNEPPIDYSHPSF